MIRSTATASKLKKSCIVAAANAFRNSSARRMLPSAANVLVTVVPMFAPMIIGTARFSGIVPAPTIPTIVAVETDDDCTSTVARTPTNSPANGLATVERDWVAAASDGVIALSGAKEGEVGQQKITQYTRYLTVGLSFGQALGYVFLFQSQSSGGNDIVTNLNGPKLFLIVLSLTAGATLLMWLGELITQRGIGNGISLMIFASIVSGIPGGISKWWTNADQVFVVMMPFVALAVIVAIVFVQEGQRRIPVQYAKRVVGRRMTSGGSTYLPLRVNMAGVIPVIFAASMMAFPPTIGQLINTPIALDFAAFFSPNGWAYVAGEVFFIIIFTYFYTAVTFNPVDQADNLKKHGGFIPGVRPGRPTAEYLDRILSRLTFPGALYLGAVAALPTILFNQTSANFYFGGTSILIVVGVALDFVKQLEAQLMMRNYEGFLK